MMKKMHEIGALILGATDEELAELPAASRKTVLQARELITKINRMEPLAKVIGSLDDEDLVALVDHLPDGVVGRLVEAIRSAGHQIG